VPDGLPAAQEVRKAAERVLWLRRAPQLLLLDARQAEHGVGYGPPRVDELLERRRDILGREGDRTDLDDPVSRWIETRGLQVERDEFVERFSDFRTGLISGLNVD